MRTVILAMLLTTAMTSNRRFVDALVAPGPDPEHAADMTLYDGIVGDWDADVIDYAADGSRTISRGEWHVAWVLEGRAIQDVWIVPPRSKRQHPLGTERITNRYGTSIRVYDPDMHAWNVTWINPVTGAFNRLVGRKHGDDIVHDGHDSDGTLIRWTFSEITRTSFHWRGEFSKDGGKTWRLAAEFFGRRRAGPPQ
jgi:hypothetical protein